MVVDPLLDAKRVAEIVRTQFLDVKAAAVHYLGAGYDSTAFEVDGRWVFRFPKRADVEQQMLMEMQVLPILAQQSPLAVPAFCFQGIPSPAFPRHFGGYPKLPGMPAIALDPASVPLDAWARDLATFLSWLHGFKVAEAAALGVGNVDVSELIDEVARDAIDDLDNVVQAAPDRAVDKWRTYLSSPPSGLLPIDAQPVLVHGDLAAEHVLCDPETMVLTGVVDWSEMAIADRSVDLAALFHWGGRPFVDAVLTTYAHRVNGGTLARARYLAAGRGAADVTFGLEMSRPEYIRAGLRALELCIG